MTGSDVVLNHMFSWLRVLVLGESITPGCPVWFGHQEKVQEGCWKWSRKGVGLRVDRVKNIQFVS